MDEPTDRALKLQGLSRAQYDSLEPAAKEIIAGRSRRLVDLSNITLASELLNAVVESDESSGTYIREALEGSHPEFAQTVAGVVREYLDAGVDTGIRDYYRIKYGSAGIIPKAQDKAASERDAEDLMAPAGQPAPPTLKPQVQAASPQAETAPKPQAQAAAKPRVEAAPRPQPEAGSPGGRRMSIAVILSRWEGRSVDSVMKTEGDVIDAVISVTDGNRALGLTDADVCGAVEAMVKEDSAVQFPMEALMPEHRAELLDKAGKKGT